MCGLEQAFYTSFQTSAMDEHMKNPLCTDAIPEKETNTAEGEEETSLDENV